MIRIGLVNIDTSHPGAFAEYMAKGDRARFAAIYNDGFRGDDEVAGYMRKYSVEKRYADIAEMAVDADVDVGFVLGCDWDAHLRQALPFIRQNKPVFIDKPFAGNIRDCRELEGHAANGAVILGASSMRYAREIVDFLAKPEAERGSIVHIYATVGSDEFNYPIHIAEAICGMINSPAASCRFIDRTELYGKVCEVYSIRFENGVIATYNTFHNQYQPSEMVIMTTKSTYRFTIGASGRLYQDMLDKIFDYIETGVNTLASVPELTAAVKVLLAGRISRECGGAAVRLADIPADDPGFDGAAFARGYAAASKPMYL